MPTAKEEQHIAHRCAVNAISSAQPVSAVGATHTPGVHIIGWPTLYLCWALRLPCALRPHHASIGNSISPASPPLLEEDLAARYPLVRELLPQARDEGGRATQVDIMLTDGRPAAALKHLPQSASR